MSLALLGIEWLSAEWWLNLFGPFILIGVFVIVFLETGVLVLSFLPGDSLLFTVGLLSAIGTINIPVFGVILLIALAAWLGDQLSYTLGKKLGPAIFKRPDSKFFNQENVKKTNEFFDKHGAKAIILARFLPVFRAFVPAAAGVGKMNQKSFAIYNIAGAIIWSTTIVLLGFFLGQINFVQKYAEYFIIAIVLISGIPIIREILLANKKSRKNKA